MRDLIRSFAATAIIQIANIASGVLLARILLPVGRGELAVAMLWPSLVATLGTLGISEATAFLVARRAGPPGQIFATGMILALVLSALLLPIGWIVVDGIAADFSPEARAAAFLYLAFIPLNQIGLVVVAMHQGSLSIGRWNVLRTSVHVVYAGLIPAFYVLGWDSVVAFASASLLANVVVIAFGLTLARGRAWFADRPRLETMRGLLSVGARVHLSNAVAMLNERLDQLFISLLLAPVDLGLYVVAATVARGLGAIGDTLATLVFPKTAQVEAPRQRAEIVGRYARAAVLISVPPVIAGIVLAQWLIVLIFGPSFASATSVMQVLLLVVVPLNVKSVMAGALKGANQALAAGAVQAAALAISAVALGALLPAFGLMGAALAALVAQIAAAAMMAAQVRRRLGVDFRDQFWPRPDDIAFALAALRPRSRAAAGKR